MKAWVRAGQLALAVCVALVLALAGCSKRGTFEPLPNAAPEVEITQAPSSATQPYWYAYEMRWTGRDADGSIAFYEYTVDPPTVANAETTWTRTEENRQVVQFRASQVDGPGAGTGRDYHTFVLRAVDDRGGRSLPVARSFNAYTIAPTVQVISPRPSTLLAPQVGTTFSVKLTGTDPDGRASRRPVKYKWKIFGQGNTDFDFLTMLVQPDSLRRFYAPTFAGWDSAAGDTATVLLRDLVPDRDYVFVAVSFDEAGAYSPVFSYDLNMLFVHVDLRASLGPKIRVFNESFDFTSGGAYSTRPLVTAEVPANQPVRFNWSATAATGGFITSYRWAVDIGSVTDDTPRSNEDTDLTHWSQPSPATTAAVVPATPGVLPGQPRVRFFYVEATDNADNKSLLVVQFTVIQPSFDRPLLIVDDTRFRTDRQLANGCVQPPQEAWPTAAELDTFLYAKGNVPWRCYPTGTLSQPGVFAGYDYDTLGTRGSFDPTVSLRTLGRYRHIVWYVDRASALYTNQDVRLNPITSLRYMATPGRSNTLGTWAQQGGKLWLFGGGVATALQLPWERVQPNSGVYSNTDGELVPGRFMYDVAGWRSEITIGTMINALLVPPPAHRTPGVPNWSQLPTTLREKTFDSDPVPPQRQEFDFYQSYCFGEWLTRQNLVTEGVGSNERVTLDTLYLAAGAQAASRPAMTYHHGSQTGPTMFTGFPIWYLRRTDAIAITDFVLQNLWGLPRQNVNR